MVGGTPYIHPRTAAAEHPVIAGRVVEGGALTGNVRQLRNVIERLYILGANPITGAEAERYA